MANPPVGSPTDRASFKQYCLRRLGRPVIEINVSDEQVEDRINDALAYWYDYHWDGGAKVYYKHLITSSDVTNKYITLPSNIMGAVRIFPLGALMGTDNMFNIQYQIALNDLYTLTSYSMVPYFMAFQHLELIQELLIGQVPIRYNRHQNLLYVDMSSTKFIEGQYLLVEAYEVVDPELYSRAWSDRLLQQLATAYIKRQWGSNTKKFTGLKGPGGVEINGQQIYNEAVEEITSLEQDIMMSWSASSLDRIG